MSLCTYKRLVKHNSRHFAEKTVGTITPLVMSATASTANQKARKYLIVKMSKSHKCRETEDLRGTFKESVCVEGRGRGHLFNAN